jgi:hypothetical protein
MVMSFKVATSLKQAAWECHWARAGRRLMPDPDQGHAENLWICVRPTRHGTRRVVSEHECDGCEYWRTQEGEDEDVV